METKLTVMHCSVSFLQHSRIMCITSVSQEVILLLEPVINSLPKFDGTHTKHLFGLHADLDLSLQRICMSSKKKHSVNKDQRKSFGVGKARNPDISGMGLILVQERTPSAHSRGLRKQHACHGRSFSFQTTW